MFQSFAIVASFCSYNSYLFIFIQLFTIKVSMIWNSSTSIYTLFFCVIGNVYFTIFSQNDATLLRIHSQECNFCTKHGCLKPAIIPVMKNKSPTSVSFYQRFRFCLPRKWITSTISILNMKICKQKKMCEYKHFSSIWYLLVNINYCRCWSMSHIVIWWGPHFSQPWDHVGFFHVQNHDLIEKLLIIIIQRYQLI